MPQNSLLPGAPIVTGYRFEVNDLTSLELFDGALVMVYVRYADADYRCLWAGRLEGIEVDLIPNLASEVTTAFLWATPREIVQKCQRGKRAAKVHRKQHERV